MKILFVHDRFGAFGGAEANILATAHELKARGHELAILHGPATGESGTAWSNVFEQRYALQGKDESSRTNVALRAFAPDVVYLHKMADLPVLETLLNSCVPVARMVHDHDLYCMRSYKYNYFTRRVCDRPLSPYCVFACGGCIAHDVDGPLPLKWVSYRAKTRELNLNHRMHRLIVATQFMKKELLRNRFDGNRIEVHAPVPPHGDISWRSSFGDHNYIVYAGQITRGKGVDVLLESLALVRAPFTCFIFGDGSHREYCQKLSRRLGLADRVTFKGFVSAEEIAIFYREASVVAVSSVWPEPFGAVGLEAMRFGLPVVAFDVGGIKEWLLDGHNGYLVPSMDRAAYAGKIDKLLADKLLAKRMGEHGRQLVVEHFDFSKYVNGLENLFVRVAAEVSGGRQHGPVPERPVAESTPGPLARTAINSL